MALNLQQRTTEYGMEWVYACPAVSTSRVMFYFSRPLLWGGLPVHTIGSAPPAPLRDSAQPAGWSNQTFVEGAKIEHFLRGGEPVPTKTRGDRVRRMYEFIKAHRKQFPTEVMCRELGVLQVRQAVVLHFPHPHYIIVSTYVFGSLSSPI